jgi:hypothetical protein
LNFKKFSRFNKTKSSCLSCVSWLNKAMLKLLLILLVGLAFESTGVVLLKKGITQIGDMQGITAAGNFPGGQIRRGQPPNPSRHLF